MKKLKPNKLIGGKNIYILLATLIFFIAVTAILWPVPEKTNDHQIVVYKSPTCECCNKWISHLEKNGFKVKANNTQRLNNIKEQYGIRSEYSSCHTAVIGKYFVEGHVPAKSIERLLKEKPDIKGITVPGMPIGSPGMEVGNRKQNYNVIAVKSDGSLGVYDSY